MTRLTKKGVTPVDAIKTSTDIANLYHVYNKLSKLEDIEEDLGVDLIKLLRAKTIYTKHKEISECIIENINFEFKHITYSHSYMENSYTEFFKDYGKTWAFTKEELEK